MSKKIKLTVVAIFIMAAAILSVSIYAANSGTKSDASLADIQKKHQEFIEASDIEVLSKLYGVSKEDILKMKAELGDISKVSEKLSKDEENKALSDKLISQKERVSLYEQGYSMEDMRKADELARDSIYKAKDLLKEKGTSKSSKNWDEIIKSKGIDTRPPARRMGISEEQEAGMKALGLDDKAILEVAVMSKNYKKDVNSIINDVKSGKKIEKLNTQYENEWQNSPLYKKEKDDQKKQMDESLEKYIKDKYKISDEEMKLYEKNDVRGSDILVVKALSKKYGVSIDTVLQKKKAKGDLKAAAQELEGETK